MGEEDEPESSFSTPPRRVSLSPFTPIPSSLNPRRLSSQFSKPTSPVRTGSRTGSTTKPGQGQSLAWLSLQGRLQGADEATSARAIGGGLSKEEAVAWELFSPIHRVLIVAVAAAAASKAEKSREIHHLRNCVHLRDQILMSMQQKLDDLCEELNYIKDQPQAKDFSASDFVCSDCWLCDQNRAQLNDLSLYQDNSLVKAANGDEIFKSRPSMSNDTEQEERRMSDLSDWASSATSVTELQAVTASCLIDCEQDIYNLKRECEEKDAAIKELSEFINSKDAATSKRIEELEEIIRRKNTTITKLKRDMMVLEQKVVNLTRLRRRSFSGASTETKQLPTMSDNLLYDMDSPTSPLSSDSDCSSKKQNTSIVKSKGLDKASNKPIESKLTSENVVKRTKQSAPTKSSSSSQKLSVQIPRSPPVSPLKEKSMNQGLSNSVASPKLVQASAITGIRNNRRRSQNGSNNAVTQKRWA